jgi:lysophospholipase L1-like esterase
MKIFIIVLIIVIVYFGFEGLSFWYRVTHRPTLPAIDQSDKTLGTGPALRYIAAGDSVTVGSGASNADYTYAYGVLKELSKTHTVSYKNIAIVGDKTQDLINKQLGEIIAFQPDIVTISIGGNDATHQVSNEKIITNFKKIIQQIKDNTKAKIYISDVPNFYTGDLLPWFYIELLEHQSSKLNPILLTLSGDRVTIINIHDFGIYAQPKKQISYAADHFHPNDLGYQNWTNAFLDKIK